MLCLKSFMKTKSLVSLTYLCGQAASFNNDEKSSFQTIASLAALAMQNAKLYHRIFLSEETLRRSERLTTLGLLAAEIAHEIRNPHTVIKLLFDSLDDNFPEDDPRRKDTEIIYEKIQQLEDIVGRVLEFGKSSESMKSDICVNNLVEDTIRLVRMKLKQQNRASLQPPLHSSICIHQQRSDPAECS